MGVLRTSLLILALLPAVLECHAQRIRLRFEADTALPPAWLRNEELASPALVPAAAARQVAFLHGKGFLEAAIDTCMAADGATVCWITAGRPYRWATLSGAGIPVEIASEARFKEKLFSGRPVTPRQVEQLIGDLLRRCENSGYPFAVVELDSLRRDRDGMYATVRLTKGPLTRIDSVVVKGDARTNMRYLEAYIGVKPGDLYNEGAILGVERRLRELPFINQRQRPYVQFTPERTKLYLFLDSRKASSINGILGVQPDPITGKVGITGDLDLRLRNALRRGEAIALNWRSLQDQTQDLRVALNLPFLFNTPFGTDASLKLFKRDTTFLEVTTRAGIDYLLQRGDKVTLFVNSKRSDRLGSNLVVVPGLADTRVLSYGLALQRERFDYRFNPRRGIALNTEASVGRKRTSQATFAQGEQPPENRSVQYELMGHLIGHLPLARRSTLRLAGQGGWMVNDDLFRNELYRIGGLRTLRGTDEQSIFASAYAIGTLEYRFLFEENSHFFAFIDQGWWEDRSREDPLEDSPLGFGAGITFETKAGLFSITYALGRAFDNPVALRGGKVHFGFLSLF
jgi:outer membrane protein assembly factor BamA